MGQRAFLAGLDASLHASFEAADMADIAQYTPPAGGLTIPYSVYVSRDIETVGDLRRFKQGNVEVDYVIGSVRPEAKGRLLVDGELYANASEISNDGSVSRWQVRRVAA